MAEYLQIAPHKLIFRFEQGTQSSATITLQASENPTDERIAFKVKTTAPQKYSVRPAAGILEAQGDARLVITMAAPKPPFKQEVKERFLVEALAVGPEVAAPTSELFKANAGSVSSTKLRVAWLEPKKGGAAGPAATAAAAAAGGRACTPPGAGLRATAGSGIARKQQQQQRQQQQQPKKSPAAPTAGGPHAARVSPAAGALALLPGATRLAKASPAAAPQVPADVLAAFAVVPAPAEAVPAAAARAAAPAAAVAPAGAGKFSAALRKQMAKLQQRQQGQQQAAHQPQPRDGLPAQAQDEEQLEQSGSEQPQPAAAVSTTAAVAKPPESEAAAAAPDAAGQAAGLDGEQFVGQAVKKKFKGRCYAGKVLEYLPEEEWWLVKYEDSDEEHIDFKELQRILVAKPSKTKTAQHAQHMQHVQQAQQAHSLLSPRDAAQARPAQLAAASPSHSALVSHHTELAPAEVAAEDIACTAVQLAAKEPVQAAQPSAARRLPTRGARLDAVLKAQQHQRQPDARTQQQQQQPGAGGPGQQPAAAPAEQLPSKATAGDVPAGLSGADAASGKSSDGSGAPVAASDSTAVKMARPSAMQQEEDEEQEQLEAGSEEEADEQGAASSEDDEAELAAEEADSDPDFTLDAELLPEEVEEQGWMAKQRRLHGLLASPGDSGGVAARAGRRRRSSAAAAAAAGTAAAAVKVKEEQQEQLRHTAKPRQQEVVDLLTDSDSGAENVEPATHDATRLAAAPPRPRTKAAHPAAAHGMLRLTFASVQGWDVLAEVLVRGCAPLRSVAAALAVRCLEGGSEADAAHLRLSLQGGQTLLEQGLTVKAAGLRDGSCILVGLPGVAS